MGRIAFSEAREAPETLEVARLQLLPRYWRFFWPALWLGLLAFVSFFLVFGIFFIVTFAASMMAIGIQSVDTARILLGLVVASWVWLIVGGGVVTWILARFSLTDLCIAVEPTLKTRSALARSWRLTRGHGLGIQWIWAIAFLFTLPIILVSNFLTFTLFLSYPDNPTQGILVGLPVSVLLGSLLIPVWQCIKAVIYLDMRVRKEGLEIQPPLPPLEDEETPE